MTATQRTFPTALSTLSSIACLVLLIGLSPTAAHAIQDWPTSGNACYSPTGQDVTESIKLVANIEMVSTDQLCFDLTSGSNLDLNGFNISCADSSGCGTAVRGDGTNNVVKDGSIGGGAGTIDVGIEDAREVRNMSINTRYECVHDSGDGDVRKVIDNDLTSGQGRAADLILDGATHTFSGNEISYSVNGLRFKGKPDSQSGNGPLIENNTIYGFVEGVGIEQDGANRKFRVFGNAVTEIPGWDGVPFASDSSNDNVVANSATWDDNTCSDSFYCGSSAPPPPPTCQPPFTPACNNGTPVCE